LILSNYFDKDMMLWRNKSVDLTEIVFSVQLSPFQLNWPLYLFKESYIPGSQVNKNNTQ